jgi:hypothetical protein
MNHSFVGQPLEPIHGNVLLTSGHTIKDYNKLSEDELMAWWAAKGQAAVGRAR